MFCICFLNVSEHLDGVADFVGFLNPAKVLETSSVHVIFLGFILYSLISLLPFS